MEALDYVLAPGFTDEDFHQEEGEMLLWMKLFLKRRNK
jgi:hypothetical protein